MRRTVIAMVLGEPCQVADSYQQGDFVLVVWLYPQAHGATVRGIQELRTRMTERPR